MINFCLGARISLGAVDAWPRCASPSSASHTASFLPLRCLLESTIPLHLIAS